MKISQLTSLTSLSKDCYFPLVQSGTTKRVTLGSIIDYLKSLNINPAGYDPPTLTRTSSNGANPILFDLVGDVSIGEYIEMERARSSAYSTSDNNYKIESHQVKDTDVNALLLKFKLLNAMPAGETWLHARKRRDDGTFTLWSNDIHDILADNTTHFSDTNKTTAVTLANNNNDMIAPKDNNWQVAALSATRTSAVYFEVDIISRGTAGNPLLAIGVAPPTSLVPPGGGFPAQEVTPGGGLPSDVNTIGFCATPTQVFIYFNSQSALDVRPHSFSEFRIHVGLLYIDATLRLNVNGPFKIFTGNLPNSSVAHG